MAIASNLGFPRIGEQRELKKALESYWKQQSTAAELQAVAQELRLRHWRYQTDAGIDAPPSNDFSFYDQVLDTTALLGAVPARFGWNADQVDLETYFAMARGRDGQSAMEMTKWFDTNYHFIVPELAADQTFRQATNKPLDEFNEAKAAGITTRPVLLGPVTYLLLGKCVGAAFDRLTLLDSALAVYCQVIRDLVAAGAQSIQIDEPILVCDLDAAARAALVRSCQQLRAAAGSCPITLATYFGPLLDNTQTACSLDVSCLHVDLVHGAGQLDTVLSALPGDKALSLGLVSGRNIWRTDLDQATGLIDQAVAAIGADRIQIAPSCSLLHSPIDLDHETGLDSELRSWLSFAKQKLAEVSALAQYANGDTSQSADFLAHSRHCLHTRRQSPRVHNPAVKQRLSELKPEMGRRQTKFAERWAVQTQRFQLPLLPTTTIGSFPQTPELRKSRAQFKRGEISATDYDQRMKQEIEQVVRFQEEIGLDVLVHGEPERNDMVEYFGEQLSGFAFTQNGWVQSYGSRCVKPPVIYGDVSRPTAMTVAWAQYAQSLTTRPMKGMLTGPVTILQWSFVRDDQPRSTTCRQIALAIRDEVSDLEAAGIAMIQVDEAAIREGLPLRRSDWKTYLDWAVESFRISTSSVADSTQIHTHMCYSEFNEIIDSIAAMDADVISIESSRSKMELLGSIQDASYPGAIGPGVYDIHSPRVPDAAEISQLIAEALKVVPRDLMWVNPDCGLKTRGWPEVKRSLQHMVGAAAAARSGLSQA